MSEVFGEFIEEFPLEGDLLELRFTSSSKPTKESWRNNRLSADFVADYFSNLLSVNQDDAQREERIKDIKNTVSYIGNELLENAIKFHEYPKHHNVKLGIYFRENLEITVVIYTRNSVSIQRAEKYQAFINLLLTSDANELYIQQIETTAAEEFNEVSGLGLLTLVNDYSAKLGWKFESEPSHPQIITVTTMVQVVV